MDQTSSSASRPYSSTASSGAGSASTAANTSARGVDGGRTSASAREPASHVGAAEGEHAHLGDYLDDARAMARRAEISLFKHPYSTLGAVAAISFFAGSVLGSRLGQLALAAGVGYSLARVFPDPAAIGKKLTSV